MVTEVNPATASRSASVLLATSAAVAALVVGAGPAHANDPNCLVNSAGLTNCNVWLSRQVGKTVNNQVIESKFTGRATWQVGNTRARVEGNGCSVSQRYSSSWCGGDGGGVTPTAIDHLTYLTVTGVRDAGWSGTSSGRRELLSPTTLLLRNRAVDVPAAYTSYNLRFTYGPASRLTNDTRSRFYFGTQTYDLRAVRTVDLYR